MTSSERGYLVRGGQQSLEGVCEKVAILGLHFFADIVSHSLALCTQVDFSFLTVLNDFRVFSTALIRSFIRFEIR